MEPRAVNWDHFRIEFNDAGNLLITGWNGHREPICRVCGEPIPWVLDMMSFSTKQDDGCSYAQHAACAWLPEAFTKQRKRAKRIHRGGQSA
jgi:hypothetical protein